MKKRIARKIIDLDKYGIWVRHECRETTVAKARRRLKTASYVPTHRHELDYSEEDLITVNAKEVFAEAARKEAAWRAALGRPTARRSGRDQGR
jgi:hypothetical protein